MRQRVGAFAAVVVASGVIAVGSWVAKPPLEVANLVAPDRLEAQALSEWTVVTSTTGADLYSVSALSSDDMWAVGSSGTLLHWDGAAWRGWRPAAAAPEVSLNAVAMVSPTDGWVVGDDGAIFRWNGRSWAETTSPTRNTLTSLAMVSASDGWAVGWGGTVLRWDGVRWSPHSTGVAAGEGLTSVSMAASDDGWAVGWFGSIVRWDGAAWGVVASPEADCLAAVAAVSADEAWAVGRWGTILRWDGASWSTATSPTRNELNAVTVSPSGEGWAVGQLGTILRWDGRSWSPVQSPTTADLAGVAQASEADACAVGRGGTILHRGTFEATATPTRTSTPTRTPRPSSTPTATITPGPSPTPTATSVVRGSVALRVTLLSGDCSSIGITGIFSATSAVAPVGEMRTGLSAGWSCRRAEPLVAPWRPFAATDRFVFSAPPHYFQAALSAQYRDGLGNVSPVYCADADGICMGTPTPPPCADAFEPDDSAADATVVTVEPETHTSMHSICPEGDVDFVAFDAHQHTVYRLFVDSTYHNADVRLQLYGADVQTEIALHNSCSQAGFCTYWLPSESGRHYLKASETRPGFRSPYDTYRLGLAVAGHTTAEPPRPVPRYLPLLPSGGVLRGR